MPETQIARKSDWIRSARTILLHVALVHVVALEFLPEQAESVDVTPAQPEMQMGRGGGSGGELGAWEGLLRARQALVVAVAEHACDDAIDAIWPSAAAAASAASHCTVIL